MIDTIYPKDLQALRDNGEGKKLLDVRNPEEFAEVHANGAVNIPLDQIEAEKVQQALDLSSDDTVYIICRSGRRSMVACQKLEGEGLENAFVNVEGGTLLWVQDGLPTG